MKTAPAPILSKAKKALQRVKNAADIQGTQKVTSRGKKGVQKVKGNQRKGR